MKQKVSLRTIKILLALLAFSGCSMQAELKELLSKVELTDCEITNSQITNAPCLLQNAEDKYLSETQYSGRTTNLTTQNLTATTNISYANGVISKIELTSTVPAGWSDTKQTLSLDKSTTQQGGNYNKDYIAANIVSGVSIFGLAGTFVLTQKPYCSNINSASDTSTVAGINNPPLVADRQCMAPAGAFIYPTAYNGRALDCNSVGGTNTASCFFRGNGTQDFYATNATTVPFACTYGNNYFYDNVPTSTTFGTMKSPTINSVVRNICQVSNGQYFYPQIFGGRDKVCAAIANPPCWLDIPDGQQRTVSSANAGGGPPVCEEDKDDNLPSAWQGTYDEPLSKNTVACLTGGSNRYVYTKAYDGRYRNCTVDNMGNCFVNSSDVTLGASYIFTTSENTTCRSNLNTCQTSCETTYASCSGNPNTCFSDLAACHRTCYSHTTTGYTKCMTNACSSTRSACYTACGTNSGCRTTCDNNFNNCNYSENPRNNVWYLDPTLRLINPTTKTLLIPTGQTRSASIPVSQLLNTNAIKAGVQIYGLTGSFGGLGAWGSAMHRSMQVPQMTLNEENNAYSGSSGNALPTTATNYFESTRPYREVAVIAEDDEGSATSKNVTFPNRATWGTTNCGLGATLDSVDKKIADCNAKFGSDSSWDGAISGNAGQGRWALVTRKLDATANRMVEVWRDERTMMLWSSLISESINWCKASGSSNNPGVNARYREVDPSNICSNQTYQEQTASVISACLTDTGFTNVDTAININGKVDLTPSSAPKIHWRIPTLYDYEVADYNGIRFVMPDMGVARTIPLTEWTGTINSLNRAEAWVINSTDGAHRFTNRSDTAGVRCIGR